MTREKTVESKSASPPAELVRVENLRVHLAVRGGRLRQKRQGVIWAVDGVSFSLRQGETLGLVGAANCGKTTLARAVALLDRPTSGRILFQGQALTALRGRGLKRAQRRIQMLFSDPYVTFAPRMSVEKIISEALNLGRRQRDQRLADLMDRVGLNLYLAVRYPRELSGGNRQRVALARALAAEPSLLVCDQWTAHLDPALGRDLMDLLHEQNQRLGLAVLLTARRLETARHAERVAIMVMGRIVEMGYYADLVRQPLHPFTQALLRSRPDDSFVTDAALNPLHPPGGCHYEPLCPLAQARCRASYPPFVEGAPNHGVACHLVESS
jgi:oligopeptide/dipeptide ABC transporter ATP-binding protein